ncbi:MAG: segregation and condensation protein [Candidatus Eremiobacteraeota bacterium]|jgi:segregation and condensation protein B|nr:segregation and condensation protein [Candidatus Eremiobacteraeota bacterium]
MQPDLGETDLLQTEPGQTGVTETEPSQTGSTEAEPVQTAFVQPELVETGKLQRDLEALLFVASEALSIKQLAKLTGAEESAVTVALQKIDEEFAHRGIVVREIAGGYRFASAPAARDAVEAYLMPPKTNLSAAALETLAIVAYMQPVTKGEVEGIRGVSADSVIATLVDRRFLTDAGKRDTPGRPTLYKTTPEFLEAFGLRSLDELPSVDVDGAMPLELALPIPTALVPLPAQAPVDEDSRDESVAETTRAMTLDRVENHPPEETAVGETIVAEEETEPQPSPEPQPSTA